MRQAKVIGFSVPPEIYQKLNRVIQKKHKTKSEFFREMIDVYFQSLKVTKPTPLADEGVAETDLAKILRTYWELRTSTPIKTIIIALGIIIKRGKVLIGARKEKDPWVENLTWVFPGGRLKSLDFEKETAREVKEETGLEVTVKNLVAARIYPDSGLKPVQIVALYFHCEQRIRKKYAKELGIKDLSLSKLSDCFQGKRYCILIFFDQVERVKPFEIDKTGFGMAAAWLCVDDIETIKKNRKKNFSRLRPSQLSLEI